MCLNMQIMSAHNKKKWNDFCLFDIHLSWISITWFRFYQSNRYVSISSNVYIILYSCKFFYSKLFSKSCWITQCFTKFSPTPVKRWPQSISCWCPHFQRSYPHITLQSAKSTANSWKHFHTFSRVRLPTMMLVPSHRG